MHKKVLFAASTGAHIRQFHLPYLAGLRKMGVRVHVACAQPGPEPLGDRTIPVPFEKKPFALGNFRALALLRRELNRENYDAVLVHTTLAAFFTRLAVGMGRRRPKVVNVVHGYLFDGESPPLKGFAYLMAERLLAPVTDLVVTMNRWDENCAKKHRLGKAVAFVDGMGVDYSALSSVKTGNPQALREELGLKSTDFVLIYPAEFSRRKSQAVLLRAMTELPDRVKLVLPGEGMELERCRGLAEELGIAHRVIFPGHVSDVGRWYEMADCSVSASRSEGLPFHMLEALFFSLPVVASRVKGHEDLIREGENGLLYPYGDFAESARCIRAVMEDPEKYRNAPKTWEKYGLERVFPQLMAHYRKMLE